jgi:hypothetical protein
LLPERAAAAHASARDPRIRFPAVSNPGAAAAAAVRGAVDALLALDLRQSR